MKAISAQNGVVDRLEGRGCGIWCTYVAAAKQGIKKCSGQMNNHQLVIMNIKIRYTKVFNHRL